MYESIIGSYVKRLSKDDIKNYCFKENLSITDDEVDIIYYYVKNNWKDIMYDCTPYLKIAKEKLSKDVYEKILFLKEKYKF